MSSPNQQPPVQSPPTQVAAMNKLAQATGKVTPEPPTSVEVGQPKKRIGDVLIEMGTITEQQLKRALSESKATKMPVGSVLVKLGYANDESLGKALAYQHGLKYISIGDLELDPEVMKLLPMTLFNGTKSFR